MALLVSEKITFTGSQGRTLSARLDRPDHEPRAYGIFSHCFTCTKETLATFRVSQALAKKGFAILRFDYSGLGDSDGDFADTNFTTMKQDLLCAAQLLETHYQPAEILLGHSLGGTVSYAVAEQLTEIKAIISLASPSEADHILRHFGDALAQLKQGKDSAIHVAGKAYPVTPQFIDDLATHNVTQVISRLQKAILILHSPLDDMVSMQEAHQIYQAAAEPKSLVSLENANHILSDRQDSIYVANIIADWVDRYL